MSYSGRCPRGSSQIDKAFGGGHLSDNSVSSNHIAPGAVNGSHVAGGSLTGFHINDGSLTGADILQGSLSGLHLADKSVSSEKLLIDLERRILPYIFYVGHSDDYLIPGAYYTISSASGGYLWPWHASMPPLFYCKSLLWRVILQSSPGGGEYRYFELKKSDGVPLDPDGPGPERDISIRFDNNEFEKHRVWYNLNWGEYLPWTTVFHNSSANPTPSFGYWHIVCTR